jgi:hypothetical protein
MKPSPSLSKSMAIASFAFTLAILARSPYPLLAQSTAIDPRSKIEVSKTLKNLKTIQHELEDKITVCNGGRILTRFCPRPPQPTIEPTGAGSLVKALQQTKEAIATLELYLNPTIDRTKAR